MSEFRELPKGWARGFIGDLIGRDGIFSDGDWVESKDQDPSGDVRLIQLADVGDGKYVDKSARFLTSAKAAELKCTYLCPGDVLVARMPDPLGRAAIFPGDVKPSITVVDVCIVRSGSDEIFNKWLANTINSPQFRSDVAALQSGSTRKRIARGNLATVELVIPPANEQKRIGEKCEQLLSDLDAGIASLDRARANLKRYRAAVLKAAVEGRLTEKWRAAHPDAEPAGKLLERILAERRKKWEEAQLKKFAEKKQAPPKGWKERYPEPLKPKATSLPLLSTGWVWATMDELCWRVADSDHRMPKAVAGGVPYVSTRDFSGSNRIDFERAKTISRADFESLRKKVEPQRGDFLLSRYGTVGEVRWLRDKQPTFLASYSIACLKLADVGTGAWLNVALRSNPIQRSMLSFVRGVAQPDLGLAHIREVPIPIPPFDEQIVIAEEIARSESMFEAVEVELASNEVRGRRLRHSILKRAFDGKLVAQDPNDEPASTLLARIRAERAGEGEKGRRNGKRRRV